MDTIVVVSSSWPRTGDPIAGTFVRADALARAREGARVIVLAPEGPGIAEGGDGLEVIDVPHGKMFGSPGAALRLRARPWRIAGLVPFARAVRSQIERVAPDRIVAHWLLPCGLVVVRGTAPDARRARGDAPPARAVPARRAGSRRGCDPVGVIRHPVATRGHRR